ncbi:MAG: DUF5689 domain-containing protein [Bacteroidota bacterium]
MKTTAIKQLSFAAILVLGMVSCKKDKKDQEPTPPPPAVSISITDLKALSTGASVTLPDLKKITGTVISDAAGKNIDSKTVILQEAAGKPGIILTFDAAQAFTMGDQVEVIVSKQTLAQVNGEVVIQNIPKANASKIGAGTTVAPRVTDAAGVMANAAAWDGTLVTLPVGNYVGGSGKFSGTLSYTDGTGSVKSMIQAGSVIENTTYPITVNTFTGIVRLNGTEVRVDARNAADVVAKGGFFLTEDFSSADLGYFQSTYNGTDASRIYPDFTAVDNLNYPEFGIEQSMNSAFKAGSNDADKAFLTPGKNYIRTFAVTDSTGYADNGPKLTGNVFYSGQFFETASTITVVFAGSYAGSDDYKTLTDPANLYTNMKFDSFDAAKQGYKVQLGTHFGTAVVAESPEYHDQGIWHTVTFKNVANLVKDSQAGGANALNIVSMTKRGTLDNKYAFSAGGFVRRQAMVMGTPIVIDKIIISYDQKPTWAK